MHRIEFRTNELYTQIKLSPNSFLDVFEQFHSLTLFACIDNLMELGASHIPMNTFFFLEFDAPTEHFGGTNCEQLSSVMSIVHAWRAYVGEGPVDGALSLTLSYEFHCIRFCISSDSIFKIVTNTLNHVTRGMARRLPTHKYCTR